MYDNDDEHRDLASAASIVVAEAIGYDSKHGINDLKSAVKWSARATLRWLISGKPPNHFYAFLESDRPGLGLELNAAALFTECSQKAWQDSDDAPLDIAEFRNSILNETETIIRSNFQIIVELADRAKSQLPLNWDQLRSQIVPSPLCKAT